MQMACLCQRHTKYRRIYSIPHIRGGLQHGYKYSAKPYLRIHGEKVKVQQCSTNTILYERYTGIVTV